jgi:uncharacterized protein
MEEKMRTVKLRNSNGEICAYVFDAPDGGRATLLSVHGGPGGDHRGNDGIFDDIASYCGDYGFNLVQFDMFGAGASEGKPQDITLRTQLADYLSVLEFARVALKKPVHVVGESMGATIAALDWSQDVLTYLLLWPAFDLRNTDLQPYLGERWSPILESQGFLDDDGTILGREFMREVAEFDFSPCFSLPSCPCLIVHGKGDSAVPFGQSIRAVQEAAGETVLFAHPTGNHGLQLKEERDFTRRAVQWWLSRSK